MHLLLETPRAFITSVIDRVSGANLVSQSLFYHLIESNKAGENSVLSDCTPDEFAAFQTRHPDINLSLISYHGIHRSFDHENHPDLAFVSGLDVDRLLAWRNRLEIRMPVVGLLHSLWSRTQYALLNEFFERACPFDHLICPSVFAKAMAEQAIELSHKSSLICLEMMPFGIDLKRFCPSSDVKALRQKHQIPEDRIVLLHLSRLNPYTKTDIVPTIRNIEFLVKKYPKILLLIVGENQAPEYIAQVQTYILKHNLEAHVQIRTNIEHTAVEEWYQLSDIFVSLSDYPETFGLTVVEAMACGMPVVISDIAAYQTLIDDGEQGFKIPTIGVADFTIADAFFNTSSVADFGDIMIQSVAVDCEAFRAKISFLLDNEAIRDHMKNKGLERVASHYSSEIMEARYIAHFTRLIAEAKAMPLVSFPKPVFEHVATLYQAGLTTVLNDNHRFAISINGQALLASRDPFFSFEKHRELYYVMKPIVHHLRSAPLSRSQLAEAIPNCDLDILTMSLLYLIKHDILTFVSED
ncbi:MAG: glycosyltransferase involved in cell wall biosynthesis [Candidatus Marinamargulisbacteria bacterium]